jgi:hypothetical protein
VRPAGLLLAAAAILLAACGVKNDPEPLKPDGFPHQYPAPEPLPPGEIGPAPETPAPNGTDTTDQPMYQ